MTSNDDRCGGQARNWDWAVKIAGRVLHGVTHDGLPEPVV